ncbi:MAG TPA: CPBP family intramembrane glutamic endopeptidase, partial [Holophagaceae bacterium]
MASTSATPWQPDRHWADPLIALLATLSLLAALLALQSKGTRDRLPAPQASLQGRLMEPLLAGPRLLGAPMPGGGASFAKAESQLKEPWDRALLSVLAADSGDLVTGQRLAQAPQGPDGDRFRTVWTAAFTGGPLPPASARAEAERRLGHGYAAQVLEARLQDRQGEDGAHLRAAARRALMLRLGLLGAMGAAVLTLILGGSAFGIYLLATHPQPPRHPLPEWRLSGRAAALVLLLWFLAFFLAGTLAAAIFRPWPALRWLAVPLGYSLHAAVGVALVCRAEGLSLGDLRRRVLPGRLAPALGLGFGFLGLAVVLVFGGSLLLSPFLPSGANPQRELIDLLRGLQGWGPTVLMFLVVAVLAPCFEELLFRGFLLPVLARRMSAGWAVVGSALVFGAIHLQPLGLPTLTLLG